MLLDNHTREWSIRLHAGRILRTNSFGFAALLTAALLIATLAIESGGFGLTDQLANVAPAAIAALATAPSIIGGGFDISISPLVIFANSAFVVWLVPHGLGGAVSVPIILGLGLVVGALTGLLVVLLRVPAVVVTLAMYFTLQGVDLLIAPTPVTMTGTNWVTHLAQSIGPIPGGLFTMGIPMLIWIALRYVPFRRLLYAMGSNDATAFSSGVDVNAIRVISYALGGLFAAWGGLALTGLVATANSAQSTEYTLTAIAAVVLGGTSLLGGRGGLLGPLLGSFAIFLLQDLLAILNVDPAYLQIAYGGILVIAVIVQGALASTPGVHKRNRTRIQLRRERVGLKVDSAIDSSSTIRQTVSDFIGEPNDIPSDLADERRGARSQKRDLKFPGSARRWAELQKKLPILQIAALIAVFIYGAVTLPGLSSWTSIRTMLVLSALIGLASGGQTLLILMGGFDLGISGFIVAAALMVTSVSQLDHVPFAAALLMAAVGSALLGGVAGYICHRFNINPLIVTLAMGTIAVGIVEVQTGGIAEGSAPIWLIGLARPVARSFGLPIPPTVVIWIVATVLFMIFLYRTTVGRHIYATGANLRAANLILINTRRVWIACFAFSAAAAALVGVLIAGFAGGVESSLGDPYLFQSVVAVIVGGTVFGGPGDYLRTCVGALFITVFTTVLVGHGATAATYEILYGLVILVAITIYGRQKQLRDRI